jgi:hypothetical protein
MAHNRSAKPPKPTPGQEERNPSERIQLEGYRPKLQHLVKTAKSLVFTPYIEATRHHLEQSSMTWQIATQIANAALQSYGTQLCAHTDGVCAQS